MRPADPLGRYADADRPARTDRPWVVANFVTALDGSVAVAGKVGELSTPVDQDLFGLLRSLADAVLVGAGTVRAEGYGPVRLGADQRAGRTARGRTPVPPIAVVSRSLDLDLDRPLFTRADPRTIVVAPAAADRKRRTAVAEVADVVHAGDAYVDLPDALAQLRRRGVEILLTEGGPLLLAELLAADLVDELCLTLVPRLGGDPVHLLPGPLPGGLRSMALDHVIEADGQLLLRYLVEAGRT